MALLADQLKKLIFSRAFRADNGRITILRNFHVCMYESEALAFTTQELFKQWGEKKSINFWSKVGVKAITGAVKGFGLKGARGHLKLFRLNMSFLDFYGWGKFTVKDAEWDKKKFFIVFEVTNSSLLEDGVELYGKKSMAHLFLMGIFTGIFSEFVERKVKVKLLSKYSAKNPRLVFKVM
jgi:predicted hydrocarbon binding protein